MSGMTILIIALVAMLALGIPIAYSIILSVVCYIMATSNLPFAYLGTTLFTSVDSFPLMAIPFFVLSGALMEGGGLSNRLINCAKSLVGHFTGGLAIVTVVCCMFFGAISGSAPATCAAIGTIVVPEMVKAGYDKRFAVALIAIAGCLGIIIPPSVPMVMYGTATDSSIIAMFMGGLIPGVLCGLALIIVSVYTAKKKGYIDHNAKFSWRNVVKSTKEAVWALLVPVIILGGIYGGIFTPTEAAVVTVVYGLICGIFIYKELTWKRLKECFYESVETTATILLVCAAATILGRVLTMEQVPAKVGAFLTSVSPNIYVLMLIINGILLIAGCILDTMSSILILAPILYPIVAQYGVTATQFGIVMIVNLAIGYCTPPVGVNLFLAANIGQIPFSHVMKAIIPMLIAMFIVVLLLTFFPDISIFLPKLMGYYV